MSRILGFRLRTLMDILSHCLLTSACCIMVYPSSGNFSYLMILCLGGILIDVDHLVDYFLFFKTKFNLRDFFNAQYLKSGKAYLPFHSWEIVFLIFVSAIITKSYAMYLFGVSLALHLAVDNIQRENPFAYFLAYRYMNGFSASLLFPESSKEVTGHDT